MTSLSRDLKVAIRQLMKAPGFAITAVLMLALGIGATTAIFSIVEGVLLRPLPYKDSTRLAEIRSAVPRFPEFHLGVSKPDFDDIKAGAHTLESLAIYQTKSANLTAPGNPKEVAVDKGVVLGKEHAEARMRVVPADNPLIRVQVVFDAIDRLPRVLRKSHMRSGLGCVDALNGRGDIDSAILKLADQHAADLGLAVRARMLANIARHFAVNLDLRLRAAG